MKLICTQENLKQAILSSARVVSKQTTLPILNNILFEAKKGGLSLSATNLEIGAIVKIGAKVEKDGKITIPAKPLSNFINNLTSEETINLEVVDQSLKLRSKTAKAIIKGLSAADFPLIPQKNTEFQLQLPSLALKGLIEKVLVAVALNEVRQELTGVNLILKEKEIFFAATDSFRLAEGRLSLGKEEANEAAYKALIQKRDTLIIPATTLTELCRIIPTDQTMEVRIAIEESQIFFEVNGATLVSRLINGKYPEYKHILPKDFKTRVVGEKNLIQSATRLASIFSSTKTSEIGLKTDSEKKALLIEAKSAEIGENLTELKMDITGPGQAIILNARYFLDGLNTASTSQVALLFNTSATPVAIKEINEKTGEVLQDYIYIVMPIKN